MLMDNWANLLQGPLGAGSQRILALAQGAQAFARRGVPARSITEFRDKRRSRDLKGTIRIMFDRIVPNSSKDERPGRICSGGELERKIRTRNAVSPHLNLVCYS